MEFAYSFRGLVHYQHDRNHGGRHAREIVERYILFLQAKKDALGLEWVFETLKALPGGTLPPTKPHLLICFIPDGLTFKYMSRWKSFLFKALNKLLKYLSASCVVENVIGHLPFPATVPSLTIVMPSLPTQVDSVPLES